jgi:hypothetical protein
MTFLCQLKSDNSHVCIHKIKNPDGYVSTSLYDQNCIFSNNMNISLEFKIDGIFDTSVCYEMQFA